MAFIIHGEISILKAGFPKFSVSISIFLITLHTEPNYGPVLTPKYGLTVTLILAVYWFLILTLDGPQS
jgi:hypothetical protein